MGLVRVREAWEVDYDTVSLVTLHHHHHFQTILSDLANIDVWLLHLLTCSLEGDQTYAGECEC